MERASPFVNLMNVSSSWRFLLLMLVMFLFYTSSVSSNKNKIPPGQWKKMATITNTSEFINKLDKKPAPGANLTESEKKMFQNVESGSLNQQAVGVVAAQIAVPDECTPTEKSVPIPPNSNASILHWPTCTRLPQCGGCCGSDILECVPVETVPEPLEVMKVIYSDTGEFMYSGMESVSLMKHLRCECRCRIQQHHCDLQKFNYNEESCSCRCKNEDLATTCTHPKIWDEKACACVCRSTEKCLSDEYFSLSSCSCLRLQVSTAPPLSGNGGIDGSGPCAGFTCRDPYRPVVVGTSCRCSIPSRSAALRSRSAALRKRVWSRGSSDFGDMFD